jgi:hypothetical protein
LTAYVSTFHLAKGGNRPEDYEDAFNPVDGLELRGAELRFAVADGATEGFLSGLWAQCLVDAFVEHGAAGLQGLRWARPEYGRRMSEYMDDRIARGKPLKWYEEPKLALGAFATLVGLVVRTDSRRGNVWQAIAVGDCCLFHIRECCLLHSFPMEDASHFSYTPALLSSRRKNALKKCLLDDQGDWQFEDVFYLASDALAHWCLSSEVKGGPVWPLLQDLGTIDGPSFEGLVEDLRADKHLRNDDVTLMRICL